MTSGVFDETTRSDATPARHNEGRFEFLNRSASQYFGRVRDLVEDWFSHIPPEHQVPLRGSLRSDDHQSSSAFWELYLHEAYRRSGFDIEIHPRVPHRSTQPDFRITHGEERFYLEAVSVGRAPDHIAEDRRLDEVHRVLTDMKVEDFGLELSTYGIGPRPLATRRLRGAIRNWLNGLDPDQVTADAIASSHAGFAGLPELVWDDEGWSLVFHAIPYGEWARGTARSPLGVMGPGEAMIVDNVTGIRRVLESKRNRYGPLDAPLVIAVQSNTAIPTCDYEVENSLFGVGSHRPAERAQGMGHLIEEGLWIGHDGWRNAAVPSVVTVYGLAPWAVINVQPRHWSTLEPGVEPPKQPAWLAEMVVGAQSLPDDATPMATHFGLADDWPGMAEPDFDLS